MIGGMIGASALAVLLAPAAAPPVRHTNSTESGRALPIRVPLRDVRALIAPAHGTVSGDGGVAGGCPDVISTHTSFNFTGGNANLQAGFAEQEVAAASYVLPASAFPIIINSIEGIFAQNHTNRTVTQWTVMVWQGNPETGSLVASFSSDDKVLPHLQLPVGNPPATAANIFFQIDPSDPEQIIIDDNGSHTFSVGYRIDQHNNQTGSGCNPANIPTNQNAFPTTDIDGGVNPDAPTQNWLFAINCGPFGCPANWSRFSELGLCEPTGDWIIRANWSSINCGDPVGACCAGAACEITTQQECAKLAGSYLGDGTQCGSCPAVTVPCCFEATNGCLNLSLQNCQLAGGAPGPPGTLCADTICFPSGACCLPDGSCAGDLSPEECAALSGTFQGNDTTCAGTNCPEPIGACCFGNGFCLALTEADCGQAGAAWMGPGSTCADGNNNGQFDECKPPAPDSDLNDDGEVNGADLGILLLAWGQCREGPSCAADLTGDGAVDGADLGELLLNWTA
jgi:hypothetical protein